MGPDATTAELDELSEFPEDLRTLPAVLIKRLLPRPTLIHLAGKSPSTYFVSILLHGDEDVGLKAVQQLLDNYRTTALPRGLSIFIGNVDAAAATVRYLPHQPDYNRVWPGSELHETREHALMRRVVATMVERKVVASIDLHNNSGRNPYYACICSLNVEHLRLAALFSRRVLYFQRPKGVQTQAFAQFCPSTTCECGPIGDAAGARAAAEILERALHVETISNAPYGESPQDVSTASEAVSLYHTIATWRIQPETSLSFGAHSGCDVILRPDLDLLNFIDLPEGETLAEIHGASIECIEVRDESGRLVTDDFFRLDDGRLRLTRGVLPSMFTCSIEAIRKDCVGYFTEHFALSKLLSGPDR